MRPLLRVVDEQGEVHEGCPGCDEAERTLVQYEKDIRILKAKITKLERDVEVDARRDPLWAEGEVIHDWYCLAVWKPRRAFDSEDFYLLKPHLKREGSLGCLKAITGAAFDPYVSTLKNGREKPNNAWEQIFRSKAKFEGFAEKAPERGWPWLIQRIESNLQSSR